MNNETQKINLALIFGGKTAEHEVSVISARNVFEAINKNKYAVTLVGITKKGNWIEVSEKEFFFGDFYPVTLFSYADKRYGIFVFVNGFKNISSRNYWNFVFSSFTSKN